MRSSRMVLCLLNVVCTIPLLMVLTSNPNSSSNIGYPRIIHGRRANASIYNFAARIQCRDKSSTSLCSGSLIRANFVLTAAHCVYETIACEVTLGGTSIQEDINAVIITDTTPHWHNCYAERRSRNRYDIGLIEFFHPVVVDQFVNMINLPDSTHTALDYTNMQCSVFGWGDVHPGTSTNYLRYANMTVLSQQACIDSKKYYGLNFKDPYLLCAIADLSKQTMCVGDSGGGLIYQTGAGFQIIGINSFIYEGDSVCGDADVPQGFIRVSYFIDWIGRVMTSGSAVDVGGSCMEFDFDSDAALRLSGYFFVVVFHVECVFIIL